MNLIAMQLWVLLLLFASALAKHEQYAGWKSYYVSIAGQEQQKLLHSMEDQYQLDFLSFPIPGRDGVTLVQPRHQLSFTKALEDLGINYRIHANDVKAQLDLEDELLEEKRRQNFARTGRRLPYDDYQTLDVIDQYLIDLSEDYPDLVTLVTPGVTFQGFQMKYLKISNTNFEDETKPIIIIDSGVHAREWMSITTVTWAIHKLVEDLTEPDLLDNFDWILMPVVNPEGYEFAHRSARWWHKNRSTDQHFLSVVCPGVDIDKNHDFYWNTAGTSAEPCSELYPGNRTLSEAETRVLKDIFHDNLHRTAMYISMHTFGSLIVYPWWHEPILSGNAFGLHTVGIAMAEAIKANTVPEFRDYRVGSSALVRGFSASGSSVDYAHYLGVPFTFAIELPGLFGGYFMEPRYIEQINKETWAGMVAGVRKVAEIVGKRNN